MLTTAVFLAGSDGHIDGRELQTAHRIGEALGMSSAHIEGTIGQELARISSGHGD